MKTLGDTGAMDYSIIVAATASDAAPLQFLAPYLAAPSASTSATTACTPSSSLTISPSRRSRPQMSCSPRPRS